MTTHKQIRELLEFKSEDYPVISFYLNTHVGEISPDEIKAQAHSLIRLQEKKLSHKPFSHAQRESLTKDFQKFYQFLEEKPEFNFKGLAIFTCSSKNFWQVYELPQKVKDSLIVDSDPYIRPLLAILNQFHRLAFLLVDQRRAQLFELFMGEIKDHTELMTADVPSRVRYAGWYGLEEKRVSRHIEQHIQEHFKQVAVKLYLLYKTHQFDYFILSAQKHILPEFEQHLHTEILDRVIERLDIEPFTLSLNEVKEKALEIERRFVESRLNEEVEKLITEAQKGRLASLGIQNTLEAVNKKAVRTLYLVEDMTISGRECHNCGYLTLDEKECPVCGKVTEPVQDLFDEVVEAVLYMNGDYYTLPPNTLLREYGGIGAWLRFK